MKNIGIIGGGYTGLVAAYRLAKSGHKVTIFEGNAEVGGLASGFKIHGENLEKAYHHLFKTDTDIINFAQEIGIGDKLKWHPSSVSIYYDNKIYPFVTPFDLLKFSPLNIFDRIRAGLVALYLQKDKNWKKFVKTSAYAWMKKWAGPNVTKVIWEPLLKGKFNRYFDKVSMAWLWARIHIRANSREKGLSKEMLGYFENGFQTFTDALVKELNNLKVEIKVNAKVQSIKKAGEKVKVKLESDEIEFDKVLATVPSHVFGFLIKENKEVTQEYIEKLNSIDYLGAVLIIFSSDQDLSKFYWHNINDLNSPFLVFINHTKLIDKSNYEGKNVYYIGTYVPNDHEYFTMSDENLNRKWFDYLKKIFSDFDEKEIKEKHFFRFKNAQHIVDREYEGKIPGYKTPVKGVYLSNFSQIFPEDRGTNFAVREGNKIAKLMESDF
jgi:protoporphyrinogen oxidase